MKKPEAILFDMDDTIVAWDIVADSSWRRTCEAFAPQAPGTDAASMYTAINHFREWYLSNMDRHRFARLNLPEYRRQIVFMAFENLGLKVDGLAAQVADAYGAEREKSAYLLPGALETLQYFKEQGVKLALVSNGMSTGQWRKVKRFNLEPLFDCILIEGDFGTGKPDGRVFQHVLDLIKVRNENTWMVGDHLHFDVGGGKAAGLYTVWVDWQQMGVPEGHPVQPDRIIRSIAELRTQEY
jgi:putative hydrolase of the HAD superfamily